MNILGGLSNFLFPIVKTGVFPGDVLPVSTGSDIKAEQVTAVMTSIKILQDNLAKCKFKVVDVKSKEIPGNRWNRLFKNGVNNYQSMANFLQTCEGIKDTTGNALVRIHQKAGKNPYFEHVTLDQIKSIDLKNGRLIYSIDGKDVDASEILHFKFMTFDGVTGMNPIEISRINWEATGRAQSAVSNFYKNGMIGNLALQSTVDYNQITVHTNLVNKWKETAGHLDAGSVKPLPPNTELKQIPISLKDQDYLLQIKANSAFVANLYQVPVHWVTGEAPKYGTLESVMHDFRVNTMGNIISHYTDELEFKLLTPDEKSKGVRIIADTSAIEAVDRKTTAEVDKMEMEMGIVTPNQLAVKRGYDEFKGGDIHILPTNNYSSINKEDVSETNKIRQ